MSQVGTIARVGALAILAASALPAQNSNSIHADWRRLGQPAIDLKLAGLATGPVTSVWFSPDGSRLFARSASGVVFETADFETWARSSAASEEATRISPTVRKPEPQSEIVSVPGDPRHLWALGRDLQVSEDGGATWTNLSSGGDSPVIGAGQNDLAVNPGDSEQIAVANDYGVWQSRDGGKSWNGLNEGLPNFPASKILSTQRGSSRIALDDGRILTLPDARSPWQLASGDASAEAEARERQRLQPVLGAPISAVVHSADLVYAGSTDGRIWVSRDRGQTWNPPQSVGRGPIERIFVDADAPQSALVAIGGSGAHIERTVNAGAVWDDVTGSLAETKVNAVTADRNTGAAYAATDRGIFAARLDLNTYTPPSAWTLVNGALPNAPASDVAADGKTGQLFAAFEGYGVYSAPSPFRSQTIRLLNAADLSTRPAAPGSVVSVMGGKVSSAQAADLKFPVLAAGENESQIQVPFEASTPGVDLSLEVASGRKTLPLAVHNVSPAIFVDHDGDPFLVDADSGLALDATAAAHPHSRLQLMATGLGRVKPDWPTGIAAPADHPPAVAAAVQVYLDGVPLEVTGATLAPGYIGYYQIEFELPAVLNAGPAQLYLSVDGQESNHVRVMVESD